MHLRYGPALLAALLLAACGDAPPPTAAPAADAPRLDAASAAAPGRSPHACFVSTATHGTQPWAYSYRRLRLRLPAATHSPAGETMEYRYRLRDAESGEIEQVVNCRLPRTWEAVEWLERRLKVPPEHRLRPWREDRAREDVEGEAVLMGCVTDGHCELPGLVAVVEPTNPEPEPVPDLCGINGCDYGGDSGGGGDATTAPGGSPDPCAECSPDAPILTCTASVTRGATVTCAAKAGDLSVQGYGWTWRASDGDYVQQNAWLTSWSGRAVRDGVVTAQVMDGSTLRTLQSSFAVTPRSWRWGSAQWTYTPNGAPSIDLTRMPLAPGVHLGINCTIGPGLGEADCKYRGRVQPEYGLDHADDQYRTAQVTSGPNQGLWYVTEVKYYMRRGSGKNVHIVPTAVKHILSDPTQAAECRQKMGITDPAALVWVNAYTFNRDCKGIDMARVLASIERHEGFGSNGSNGHEAQGRQAASQTGNDPYVQLEPLVFKEDAKLREEIRRRIEAIQGRVTNAGRSEPSGNWSGGLWFYDSSAGRYVYNAGQSI